MSNDTHIRVKRDTDSMSVTFNQIDKASEKVIKSLTLEAADVHENCNDFVTLYGITKIVQDRCSQSDSATKLDDYEELFNETLKIGLIEKERAKAGKRLTAVQAEALAQHFTKKLKKPVSIAAVEAKWKTLEEDEKKAILERDEIQDLIHEVTTKATEEAAELDWD